MTTTNGYPAGYQTRMMLLLSISFGFVFLDRNAFSYLSPLIKPELGLNYSQIGILTSALSFTWALAGIIIGRLSDSLGKRKPLLLTAFVVFSLSSVFSGLAQSFLMLLGARLIMGVAEGPILPMSQSLLALEVSEKQRGNMMGIMQNFGSNLIGSFVAPLLLTAIAAAFGWRSAFFVAAIPGLIMAALIAWYVREPEPSAAPPAGAASERVGVFAMLSNRNIWLTVLISCVMVAWMVLGWAFLSQYFTDVRHQPIAIANRLASVLGLSAAAFSFVVPRLSDHYGRKPVLVGFTLVGVAVPLAVLYFTGSNLAMGVLIFLGWSASGGFPIFMATIPSESMPPRMLATALGLVMGLGELIGGVLAPSLAGRAADVYERTHPGQGLQATMFIMAGCAVVGTLLALFLKETAPVKLRAMAARVAS